MQKEKRFKELEIFTQDITLKRSRDEAVYQKFFQYANLCRNPIDVYQFMKSNEICINLPIFWIELSEQYRLQANYDKCLECITKAKNKFSDNSKILQQILKRQCQILKEICEAIKQKDDLLKTKSLVLYSAFNDILKLKPQQIVKIEDINMLSQSIQDRNTTNIQLILSTYSSQCGQYIDEKLEEYESLRREKPECWMRSKSYSPSKSIRSGIKELNSPKRQLNKKFQTKTQDSIEILKRKRKTRKGSDEEEIEYNCNTTSLLEIRKKVHFALNSDQKKTFTNFKVQKFRSLNFPLHKGDLSNLKIGILKTRESNESNIEQSKSQAKQPYE